jgi:hypothetical protein
MRNNESVEAKIIDSAQTTVLGKESLGSKKRLLVMIKEARGFLAEKDKDLQEKKVEDFLDHNGLKKLDMKQGMEQKREPGIDEEQRENIVAGVISLAMGESDEKLQSCLGLGSMVQIGESLPEGLVFLAEKIRNHVVDDENLKKVVDIFDKRHEDEDLVSYEIFYRQIEKMGIPKEKENQRTKILDSIREKMLEKRVFADEHLLDDLEDLYRENKPIDKQKISEAKEKPKETKSTEDVVSLGEEIREKKLVSEEEDVVKEVVEKDILDGVEELFESEVVEDKPNDKQKISEAKENKDNLDFLNMKNEKEKVIEGLLDIDEVKIDFSKMKKEWDKVVKECPKVGKLREWIDETYKNKFKGVKNRKSLIKDIKNKFKLKVYNVWEHQDEDGYSCDVLSGFLDGFSAGVSTFVNIFDADKLCVVEKGRSFLIILPSQYRTENINAFPEAETYETTSDITKPQGVISFAEIGKVGKKYRIKTKGVLA